MDKEKKTMTQIDEKIQEVALSLPNVTYLNNQIAVVEDTIKILGTTLWTDIPMAKRSLLQMGMNDYRTIYMGSPPFRVMPSFTSALHQRNVDWLKKEIEKNKDDRLIVTTHHLPSNVFIDNKYKDHPLNNGFVTELDSMIKNPVLAWIAGHTHSCRSMTYNDVQCEVNSKGYPHEKDSGFRNDAVIYV